MLSSFRTPRDFAREVCGHPLNAVFFSDETLVRVARDKGDEFSREDRAEALAELATRFFFRPASDTSFRNLLVAGLGESSFSAFRDWCEKSLLESKTAEALRLSLGGAAGGLTAERMCERFQRILSADGAIPVFDTEGDAYLLPFRFSSGRSSDRPKVLDADDTCVEAWSEELKHLPIALNRDVQIDFVLPNDRSFTPEGGSLLLPLLAAWLRHEREVPVYNPLRVLFTGSFHGGLLRCVETEEKRKKVKASVTDGILVHPIPANEAAGNTTIREGADVNSVITAIREIAEKNADFEPEYALKRLVAYETDVRQTRTTDWDGVLRRLDHLLAGLDPDLDADGHLKVVLLIAAANCHAGHTAQASEWNAKARSIAAENPSAEYLLLRALIEQLVILQDSEDFNGIFELVPNLESQIKAFGVAENDSERAIDLRMRFNGSMGQFRTYANLAGVRPDVCTPDSAKRHFDEAFECAKKLYGIAESSDGKKTLRAADAAQDANYLLLWTGFFDRSKLDCCLARSLRLSERCGGAAAKNERFARRNYALGLYRSVLAGDTPAMPAAEEYRTVIERQWPEDWIAGTAAKYLGAVAAFNGDEAEAARLFRIATKAIQPEAKEVIGVIRMTIHAEAFRSLRRFPGLAAKAEEYRREALRFFVSGDPAAATKQAWRNWLEVPDATDFPGLSYWY